MGGREGVGVCSVTTFSCTWYIVLGSQKHGKFEEGYAWQNYEFDFDICNSILQSIHVC